MIRLTEPRNYFFHDRCKLNEENVPDTKSKVEKDLVELIEETADLMQIDPAIRTEVIEGLKKDLQNIVDDVNIPDIEMKTLIEKVKEDLGNKYHHKLRDDLSQISFLSPRLSIDDEFYKIEDFMNNGEQLITIDRNNLSHESYAKRLRQDNESKGLKMNEFIDRMSDTRGFLVRAEAGMGKSTLSKYVGTL